MTRQRLFHVRMGCQQSSPEACVEQLAHAGPVKVEKAVEKLKQSVWCDDAKQRRAVEAGAIEALVAAMRRHHTDGRLQGSAAITLSCCFLNREEKFRGKAAEAGAMEALVSALRNPSPPACSLLVALGLLCRGSGPVAAKCRACAVELGLPELLQRPQLLRGLDEYDRERAEKLITLLRPPGDWERIPSKSAMEGCDADEVAKACEDFGKSLVGDEAKKREAFSKGAMVRLLSVMECLTSPRAQAMASLALHRLCLNCEEHRVKAAELGALEAAELGALEALLQALQAHPGDAAVQEEANTALFHLCYSSEECRSRALKLNAFELIARALPTTKENGFVALGSLCFGLDEEAPSRRRRALELGVLVEMEKIRHDHGDRYPNLAAKAQAIIDILKAAPATGPGGPQIAGPSAPDCEEDASERPGDDNSSVAGAEEQHEASSKGFLDKLQEMFQGVFHSDDGEAGRESEASTTASFADPSSAHISESSTAPEPEKDSKAQAGVVLPEPTAAERQLLSAMRGSDPEHLKRAIQAAKAAKVRAEVLLEAHEALLVA
ncbi:GIP, partial [Symbiodinium necroappetens]